MAPQSYYKLNHSSFIQPTPPWASLTSPTSTSAPTSNPEIIINLVFGLCALTIGIVTVWQGRKAWRNWYQDRDCLHEGRETASAADVELGQRMATPPLNDVFRSITVATSGCEHDSTASSLAFDGRDALQQMTLPSDLADSTSEDHNQSSPLPVHGHHHLRQISTPNEAAPSELLPYCEPSPCRNDDAMESMPGLGCRPVLGGTAAIGSGANDPASTAT